MISVGSVSVSVVPDARNWDRDLAAQLNPAARRVGDQAGQEFTKGVEERVKKNPPKVDMPVPDRKKSDAEIDKFLADFNARMKKEYDKTGQDSGNAFSNGLRLSFLRNSPLIAAAVGGGLIAGAPLAIAGAGVLFGGIAAVAVKNNAELKAAAADAGDTIKSTFTEAAQVTVPMFATALSRLSTAVHGLEPQLASAFSALGGPLDSLTTGVISLVQNAMPGLVTAVQNAGPVFQGLSTAMGDIGTGLGQFFTLVSQHAPEAGKVLSAIGKIVGDALPVLGHLVDVGVQLGAQILPPVASVLGLVAKGLDLISPVLPAVVAGFVALKVVQTLNGPLATFAQNMAMASYQGGLLGKAAGTASTGASTLSSALGPLAVATVTYGIQSAIMAQQTDQWAQALQRGGQAAAGARDEMRKTAEFGHTFGTGFLGFLSSLFGLKPVTDWAKSSGQDLTGVQKQLNDALSAGTGVTAQLKGQLQLTADAASQANTEIGLLKGGLDALTGANVTLDQAQIAVTQSEEAIAQAIKRHDTELAFHNDQLDLSNASSAKAAQLLIQLSDNMHQEIATLQESGAATDVVNAKTDDLRQQFILQAEQLGATAGQAKTLADRYFGIPDQVHTQVTADVAQADGAIDAVQARINQLMTDHVAHLSLIAPTSLGGLGFMGARASGGGIFGPGSGTSDTAGLYALSNGEHVWTAAEVSAAGGHAAVEAIRANALANGRGLAGGGPVAFDRLVATADLSGMNGVLGGVSSLINQWMTTASSIGSVGSVGGASQWAGVALQALSILGLPAAWLGSTLRRMNQESGGNPFAINLWDSNAAAGDPSRGLMQVIGSTFRAYALPGYNSNIYDPLSNLLASMRYAEARYGSLPAAYDRPGGYALGTNYVPQDGYRYLHQGEAVVPKDQNQMGAPYQGGRSGPLMHVEHQHIHDQVDLELALRDAEFRERTGAFS